MGGTSAAKRCMQRRRTSAACGSQKARECSQQPSLSCGRSSVACGPGRLHNTAPSATESAGATVHSSLEVITPARTSMGNAQTSPQLVRDSQVEGVVEKYLSGLEAQPAFQAALQRSLAGYQPSDILDRLHKNQARQKVRKTLAILLASHVCNDDALTRGLTAGYLSHAAEAGSEECPHHISIAVCQQCAAPRQHNRLRAQRRLLCALLPVKRVQHRLHLRHRRVWDSHRDEGVSNISIASPGKFPASGSRYRCGCRPWRKD